MITADLINEFGASFLVKRSQGGEYVDGIWNGNAESEEITIRAVVQPMTARDLQMLEEGRRFTESKRVYTDTLLRTTDDETNQGADIIEIDGEDYEIHSVEKWGYDLSHFKCIAMRIERK